MNPSSLLKHLFCALVASACFSVVVVAQVQNPKVDHHLLSGGGGVSTGGPFRLTGAIVQPTVGGALVGRGYTEKAGFWNVATTIQTQDGPIFVDITGTGGTIAISWPVLARHQFALEVTSSLSPPIAWRPVDQKPQLVGRTNKVELLSTPGSKFYRLRQLSPLQSTLE